MSYTLDPTKLGLYNDKIEADLDFHPAGRAESDPHRPHASDAVFQFFGSVDSLGTITWSQPNPFTIDFTTGDESASAWFRACSAKMVMPIPANCPST